MNYKVFDNIFSDEIRLHLQELALSEKYVNQHYPNGYRASDFDAPNGPKMHKTVLEEIRKNVPILRRLKYIRSWSFVYNSQCDGVKPHADPSLYNLNVWVTPDESVEDWNKNGLRIYNKDREENLSHDDYNGNNDLIKELIHNSDWEVVSYKCNRGVLFPGKMFHATDKVHMKPGNHNRRINYTFLFEPYHVLEN